MKQFFFISFINLFLFSCSENNDQKAVLHASADTANAESAKPNAVTPKKDTFGKTIKASATLTSDSLTPGKTTAESWRISGFDDPEGFKAFFKKYKTWVAADNVDSIAAHIKFPLRNCKTAASFIKEYSTYFNGKVKRSVAHQDTDKFFANYNGAMTGDGELWFNDINGEYYVIAINNKM